jgi:hypothetical protein
MKGRILNILLLTTVILLAFSCGKKQRIIPKKELAQIYAEMFLADQWVHDHQNFRRTADTTYIYPVIFEKYGYTIEDYQASIDYYISDPEDLVKVMDRTKMILNARAGELRIKKDIQMREEEKRFKRKRFRKEYQMFYDKIRSLDSLNRGDSLMIYYMDSTVMHFLYNPETILDSIYKGPELLFPRDSAELAQERRDSIARADSIVRADSIRLEQLVKNRPYARRLKEANLKQIKSATTPIKK